MLSFFNFYFGDGSKEPGSSFITIPLAIIGSFVIMYGWMIVVLGFSFEKNAEFLSTILQSTDITQYTRGFTNTPAITHVPLIVEHAVFVWLEEAFFRFLPLVIITKFSSNGLKARNRILYIQVLFGALHYLEFPMGVTPLIVVPYVLLGFVYLFIMAKQGFYSAYFVHLCFNMISSTYVMQYSYG